MSGNSLSPLSNMTDAANDAAEVVEKLGKTNPVQFTQYVLLILLGSVIALVAYAMLVDKPQTLDRFEKIQSTTTTDLRAGLQDLAEAHEAINDKNVERFEKILDKQTQSHIEAMAVVREHNERVVDMVTSRMTGAVKAAAVGSATEPLVGSPAPTPSGTAN